MASILDSIEQQVSGTAVQQVSQRLGIDPAVAQRTVNAAIPVITAAIASHARSGGADAVHQEAAKHAENPTKPATLPKVLGDNHASVEQQVSNATGVSREDASKILNAVAPAVLSGIGQHVQEHGIDAQQLASALTTSAQTTTSATKNTGGTSEARA
jgi:hypothetical protein